MYPKLCLWIVTLLAALPAWSQSAPSKAQPGVTQVYKDWVVGCDNTLACEAISLMPENTDSDGGDELTITRQGGPDGALEMEFVLEATQGEVSIAVDGRVLATADADGESAIVEGPAALELARALAQGRVLEVKQGSKVIAQPSLAGASAALRYLDAQQNRAGTVTALVARGAKPASAVPAAPALPIVKAVRAASKAEPAALTQAEQAQAAKVAGCEDEEDPDASDVTSLYPLDAERTLALVPCGHGAYNYNSAVLIVRGKPGNRTFAQAVFDDEALPRGQDALHLVTNADWDGQTASLSSYSKGRGLGDCGVADTYTWDGSRMRLTAESVMPECRGSQSMITTWSADTK